VVCGHIHQPEIRNVKTEKGEVTYLNSGDWVENLTALEYNNNTWKIYHYTDDYVAQSIKLPKRLLDNMNNDKIFKNLVEQFLTVKK
jgi:hypothetical protein